MTFEECLARHRQLRAEINARVDNVPNLRDYGLDRRADFEAAITAYHAETQRMRGELEEVARQRMALRNAR